MRPGPKAPISLPAKLVYTALHVVMAGTLSCTSEAQSTADAANDGTSAGDGTSAVDRGTGPMDAANQDAPDATVEAAPDEAAEAVAAQDSPMVFDGPTDAVDDCNVAMIIRCDPSGLVDGAACPGFLCNPQDCPVDAGCIILT